MLLEEMGRALVPSPYLSTVVVVAPLLVALGDRRSVRAIAAGETVATLALAEPGWRDEWQEVSLAARREGETLCLSGWKTFVPWGPAADVVLIAARIEGAGVSLAALDPGAPGLAWRRLATDGGEPLFEVALTDVPVGRDRLVGPPGAAGPALERTLLHAAVGSLAYATGAAERALELTVAHARTRVQFGRPIGAFQAVAHRCVDMRSDVDALRWLVYQAAWALAAGRPGDLEVAAAKAYGNEALRRIFMHAHQVHGAIGFSTEHDLPLFTRRAKAAELCWGSAAVHRERLARAMGL
jgi:alkylation response protein AidB-like acyl-CoA dehydrogenase